jgi:hypothetical protein
VQSNRRLNETVGGMELLSTDANQVAGYQLRTFVETWVEPVLRQLVLLEQAYETDEVILALAGQKAKLDELGFDTITDELIEQELILSVSVGMGATNPKEQVQNFMQAMTSLRDLLQDGILEQRGLVLEEVIKELFGKLGYRDGKRFFDSASGEDPQVTQLKAQLQEMGQKLAQKEDPELTKARIDEINAKISSMGEKDKNLSADTVAKLVAAMFSAMQAGEVVAAVPGVAPVADKMLASAGFAGADVTTGDPAGLGINPVKSPKTGMEFTPGGGMAGDTSPNTPAAPVAAGAAPAPSSAAPAPVGPTEGMQKGIETPAADSVAMANGGMVGLDTDEQADLLDHQRIAADNARMYRPESGLKTASPIGVGSYANGGEIAGPGTGTSDSVPAVVDGQQPAAVSAGEYHVPANVVQMFGPDFFEELIKRYHVPADGQPAPDPKAPPVDLSTGDFIIPADVVGAGQGLLRPPDRASGRPAVSTEAQQAEQARLLIESNKELYGAVEFGMETRAFLESKLGKYLIGRAELERDEAMAELVNASPRNPGVIEQLQSTIKRAESIQFWMAEIIQEAHAAQEQLLAQDRASSDGDGE